ncbi:MAG: DUF3105 domain-containing protein [Anaerolineales bacterium]|nr:DUF3105 domain-containing protein [Anaerolineales bacterium]
MSKRTSTPAPHYNPSAPRTSKREQLRQERKRRNLLWQIILWGVLGAFALAIGGYVISIQRPGALPGEREIPNENAAVFPDGQALTHTYYPPSSGARYETPAPWGLAAEPVAEGNYITNLYRGGVVFLYQCAGDCATLTEQFQSLLNEARPETTYNTVKILVAPAPAEKPLPTQIVALAWNHELDLAAFDRALLLKWYKRFVNQGPGNAP